MALFTEDESDEVLEGKLLLLGIVLAYDEYTRPHIDKQRWEVVRLKDRGCFYFTDTTLQRFYNKRQAMECALNAYEQGAQRVGDLIMKCALNAYEQGAQRVEDLMQLAGGHRRV
jgi:hypothetical protein